MTYSCQYAAASNRCNKHSSEMTTEEFEEPLLGLVSRVTLLRFAPTGTGDELCDDNFRSSVL